MNEYNKTTFYLRVKRCGGSTCLYYDSLIVLLVTKYCNISTKNIKFVEIEDGEFLNDEVFKVTTTEYDILSPEEVDRPILSCRFPLAYNHSSAIIYSGLTCVLRLVVQFTQEPSVIELLGTSKKCFKACSEVSKWTALCEEVLPGIVVNYLTSRAVNNSEGSEESTSDSNNSSKLNNHYKETTISENEKCNHTDGQTDEFSIKSSHIDEQTADVMMIVTHIEEYICRTVEENRRVKKVVPYMEGRTFQLNDLAIFFNFCIIFNHSSILIATLPHCQFFLKWFVRVAGKVSSNMFIMRHFPFLENIATITDDLPSRSSPQINIPKSTPCRPNPLMPTAPQSQDSHEMTFDLERLLTKAKTSLEGTYINSTILTPPPCHPNLDGYFRLIENTMPSKRLNRKKEQLSNIIHSVTQVTNLLSNYQHFSQQNLFTTSHQNSSDHHNSTTNHIKTPPSSTSPKPLHPFQIVDFCAGSGHIGTLLCHLLPSATITMVENKEESLIRCSRLFSATSPNIPTTISNTNSTNPTTTINNTNSTSTLTNPIFTKNPHSNTTLIKTNLNNFTSTFDLAVCLHGCGLVTDLVLQKCFKARAAFVVCPCCYGAIKPSHNFSYPRSHLVKSTLTTREFVSLCQSSDRPQVAEGGAYNGESIAPPTENEDDSSPINQILTPINGKPLPTTQTPLSTHHNHHYDNLSKRCMNVVDTDRLLEARFHGYATFLSTMHPPTCSPKNNLLVGVPLEKIGGPSEKVGVVNQ